MIIIVENPKGGQGKTTTSLALALEMDYGIITNDLYSPVHQALPQGRCVKLKKNATLEKLRENRNRKAILDFGGYADRRMVEATLLADAVVVPVINAYADLQVAVKALRDLARYTKKILVVVNRAKPGDVEAVRTIIHATAGKFPILPLKTSKALARMHLHPTPVSQLVAESPLNAHIYGELHRQIQDIIRAITDLAAS
jgi:MinD superfamily P-loop ATPase